MEKEVDPQPPSLPVWSICQVWPDSYFDIFPKKIPIRRVLLKLKQRKMWFCVTKSLKTTYISICRSVIFVLEIVENNQKM